ncbi:hypothetical protein K432DRAFT_72260 [Lepidopterella palustris CBS 459.81]|uniref:Uncharacterized protein n=1 Tax=Lepidopterella palustris CBS 459.81 TaxID=1314670 RepID=A0A8E2E8W7_9PEZI|nr:hypothetical protein K432DRAFT_72260 [Lepidopterella palustris CBS 459.81]
MMAIPTMGFFIGCRELLPISHLSFTLMTFPSQYFARSFSPKQLLWQRKSALSRQTLTSPTTDLTVHIQLPIRDSPRIHQL